MHRLAPASLVSIRAQFAAGKWFSRSSAIDPSAGDTLLARLRADIEWLDRRSDTRAPDSPASLRALRLEMVACQVALNADRISVASDLLGSLEGRLARLREIKPDQLISGPSIAEDTERSVCELRRDVTLRSRGACENPQCPIGESW
jgi:hypothetical protein